MSDSCGTVHFNPIDYGNDSQTTTGLVNTKRILSVSNKSLHRTQENRGGY